MRTTNPMRTTIDLPAGTIHYRVAGPEDGRPVVFVHGFLVDDTLWSDVPERLADAGFRTFAPTWPLGSHITPMRPDAELSPLGGRADRHQLPGGPGPARRGARWQ